MMGEKKPALRFKGFEGEWDVCRLGDIVQIIMGQSPDGSTYSETPSDYILVQGNADLKNGWVTPRIWTTQATKRASAGDLIMSVRAPAGTMGKTAYNVVLGRGVAAIKGNEFLYQNLVKMDSDGYWRNLSSGSTFESLNSNDINNAELFVSSNTEQIRIGNFFKQLDTLITQQQRKYDSLLNVKKSMLEKMFPKDGAGVPEIRFKGFSEVWDRSELGELAVEVIRKAPENSTAPVMMISASSGFINQSEKYSGNNAGSSLKNYTLLQKGELSYNHGYSKFRNYGSCFELKDDEARIPFVYHSFALQNDNSTFYSQYLNSGIFDGELKKRVSSTARMDGLLNISYDAYMSINVCRPSLEEQTKIGNYFNQLDTLISLNRQKLDHLKHIKSALLEKMFVPEAA